MRQMMIKAFIEILQWSTHKYELDKVSGVLVLDRVLNQHIPANYGFIPDTLAEDGDALDVFVCSKDRLKSGETYDVRLIGMMYCNDNGVTDNKLIAKLEDDDTNYLDQLENIEHYLKTYKPGFEYKYFVGCAKARKEIQVCHKRFKDAND